MTVHRDSLSAYKTYGGVEYSLDGTKGEGITWRNVFGNLLRNVQLDTGSLLSAGVYEVSIDPDSFDDFLIDYNANSHPVMVTVKSASYHNSLGCGVNTGKIIVSVFSSLGQTGIIPGLSLTLNQWPQVYKTDRFQIIVGGTWIPAEDRYKEDLVFGELSSSGPPSNEVSITIKNISDITLTDVEAKIVDKLSVTQHENYNTTYMASLAKPAYFSTYPNSGYETNAYDILTGMTAADAPFPIKANLKGVGNADIWNLFKRGTLGDSYKFSISSIPPSPADEKFMAEVSNGYIYRDEFKSITYDLGQGNLEEANCLSLWDIGWIDLFYFYASADDVDVPKNWDFLFASDTVAVASVTAYVSYHAHTVHFYFFRKRKAYRHFKIVPVRLSNNELAGSGYIARIEILDVPIPDVIPNAYRTGVAPFSKISINPAPAPIFQGYSNYPAVVSFENVATGLADILVGGKSFDIYDVASGARIDLGRALLCDGITEYSFAEDTPYSGLSFVLSANLQAHSGAEIYSTNGSGVFEVKEDSQDIWYDNGHTCYLADSLEADDTLDISVRANPSLDIVNPSTYPVEGVLQVVGYSETETTLFTGSMAFDKAATATYTSIRTVIGPFDYTGVKVRVKFGDSATQITNVFLGSRRITSIFGDDRIQLTFDEGNPYSTATTSIWTDWASFSFKPDTEYLISYEGGSGTYKNATYSNVSYRCKDGTSHIGDYDYEVDVVNEERATSCLGIASVQIMVRDSHILTIPLTAVIRDKIPSFSITANIVDELTASALESFGITIGEIS